MHLGMYILTVKTGCERETADAENRKRMREE
jgi:hypothetical protein